MIGGLDPVLLLALGAGVSVLLLGWALTGGDDQRFQRRLARAGQAAAKGGGGKPVSLRRNVRDSAIPLVDRMIKRVLPNPEKLRRRLGRTGLAVTMGEYVLGSLVLTGVLFLIARNLFGLGISLALPIAVGGGLGGPHAVIGYLGQRRVNKFLETFADAIDLIVRGVRSGLPVVESVLTVSRECPDPIGMEFRRIADAVRLGRSLEEAMWEVAARLDTPEFKFLIIAMSIQKETGGNLAETLSNLSALLRRRRQMKLKITAMSSEARASAFIIGSLPFLMFGVLMMLSPAYMMLLITHPRGLMMVGGALAMIGLGAFVMSKMVRFEI